MRVFFRKHGNSLFYIILPIFFLFIVITFLEFTPRFSKSTVSDPCSDPDQCCNTSGCGAGFGESCVGDLCIRTNVGCPVGVVNDSPNGQCECIEDGEIVDKCVVCPVGEVFFDDQCLTPQEVSQICMGGTGCGNNSGKVPGDCDGWTGFTIGHPKGLQDYRVLFAVAILGLAVVFIRSWIRKRVE